MKPGYLALCAMALIWAAACASAETLDLSELTENARFAVVREEEKNILHYEEKEGGEWKTVWENDAILPDEEFASLTLNAYSETGVWETEWFEREAGASCSVYGSWNEKLDYAEFSFHIEQGEDGTWRLVVYQNDREDLGVWMLEDCLLFCSGDLSYSAAISLHEANRTASTFDPDEMKGIWTELEKQFEGMPQIVGIGQAFPMFIALGEAKRLPVYEMPGERRMAEDVPLDGWVMLLGRYDEGDWVMVLWQNTDGEYRTGWVETKEDGGFSRAAAYARVFNASESEYDRVETAQETALFSDPIGYTGELCRVPAGVQLFAWFGYATPNEDTLYVETIGNGEYRRGFVKIEDLHIDTHSD
ncbi:MAG: hypothetical protein Q4G52_01250 [Clostridia bacterium]|nr:hypothetical protein [Clostridia bacterium]